MSTIQMTISRTVEILPAIAPRQLGARFLAWWVSLYDTTPRRTPPSGWV